MGISGLRMKKTLLWILLILLISSLSGSASALFLYTLDLVTSYRLAQPKIIWLLPVAGFAIGLLYYYFGRSAYKGNNLLLEQFHSPQERIPFRMAPLVYIGTLVSHLVGASVGREGTAVQMGVAIADQFKSLFNLKDTDRKILIVIGISAGFASVFGTPLAASVFAIEVFHLKRIEYKYVLYSIPAAYLAHYICLAWGIHHSVYSIPFIPSLSLMNIFWCVNAGIIFGIVAYSFSKSSHFFADVSNKIKYAPLRPLLGGIVIIGLYYFFDLQKYMGLGLPVINAAFTEQMHVYDFAIKLALTVFTIGFGFKGGEVTPLFFIGATLGNILIWFIPLPFALLAGMGLVGVFSGATNTPIACILMGVELFGVDSIFYVAIACIVSFCFSGDKGIYAAQRV